MFEFIFGTLAVLLIGGVMVAALYFATSADECDKVRRVARQYGIMG